MTYRLTESAAVDFRSVVQHSAELYGAVQARRYGALLQHAILTIAAAPDRPNSVIAATSAMASARFRRPLSLTGRAPYDM